MKRRRATQWLPLVVHTPTRVANGVIRLGQHPLLNNRHTSRTRAVDSMRTASDCIPFRKCWVIVGCMDEFSRRPTVEVATAHISSRNHRSVKDITSMFDCHPIYPFPSITEKLALQLEYHIWSSLPGNRDVSTVGRHLQPRSRQHNKPLVSGGDGTRKCGTGSVSVACGSGTSGRGNVVRECNGLAGYVGWQRLVAPNCSSRGCCVSGHNAKKLAGYQRDKLRCRSHRGVSNDKHGLNCRATDGVEGDVVGVGNSGSLGLVGKCGRQPNRVGSAVEVIVKVPRC